MKRLYFSPSAQRDLRNVVDYLRSQSSIAARKFADRVAGGCRRLAANPAIGVPREDLASDLRCWKIDAYVLFYRSVDDGLEVVRVLHGARDLERFFI